MEGVLFLEFLGILLNDGKNCNLPTKEMWKSAANHPVDTGCKWNVHKTLRRRPGRFLNFLCTFNLRPLSRGQLNILIRPKDYLKFESKKC